MNTVLHVFQAITFLGTAILFAMWIKRIERRVNKCVTFDEFALNLKSRASQDIVDQLQAKVSLLDHIQTHGSLKDLYAKRDAALTRIGAESKRRKVAPSETNAFKEVQAVERLIKEQCKLGNKAYPRQSYLYSDLESTMWGITDTTVSQL